jgi:diacylglycerol kinase family enzyme
MSHSWPKRMSTRGAALIAVFGMGSVLGLVLWALVRETGAVFFAFVFVFLFAFSGWFVLTRRRIGRVLGVIGLVASTLPLVGFADTHGLLLALLFASIVVFGLTARYAVRHDHEEPVAETTNRANGGPAQSARHGVLIINPLSGGGKAERFQLPEEARKRGIEPLLLGPGDDLGRLAEQAVHDGADVIGMAGGDGSQALVASIAMQYDVAHVCIPAGTRNNFARELGLDRDDAVAALDAFTDGVERRVDLASVNEHVYVNNASLGLYAHVVQSDAYRNAKFRTWRRLLPELLGPDRKSIDLQFEGPDGKDWRDAALVMVSNNPYQVRRLGGAGTRQRLDGGRLGILAARIRRGSDVAMLATLGTAGQWKRFRGLRQWSASQFEIRSDGPIAVGLDGEAFVMTSPLRFVSLPGALRVRVPRHARSVSPAGAAVTLTRRDLTRLLRIAAGKPAPPDAVLPPPRRRIS